MLTFRMLLPFVLPHWPRFAAAALAVVGGSAVAVLRPWPLKVLFDDVLLTRASEGSAQNVLLAVVAAIAALALVDGALGYARQRLVQATGQRVASALRVALYDRLQRLSLAYHDRQRTGDLLTRLTKDVDRVQELLAANLVESFASALTLVGMVAVMVRLDLPLTVAAVTLVPLLLIAVSRHRREIGEAEEHARRREGDVASLAQQTFAAIRLVKTFGQERAESVRFGSRTEEALRANLRITNAEAAFASMIDILTALALAAVIWFGAQRVVSGYLTPGDLIVFIAYLRDFFGPVRTLSRLGGRLSRTKVRAARIAEVLREEPGVADLPGARVAPRRFSGRVEFDRVTFAYLAGRPVLHDVSFRVEPGQTVALVGSTGAGKSTIAALLLRLYDPQAGRVAIDDVDIRQYRLEGLRAQIAVVPQRTVLFAATVRENISYGRPGASLNDVVRAAKAANVHDLITGLPHGYDSVIGERGETLSGGQQQLVAIARALMRDAPCVILDEPTVGLDAATERLVLEALERLVAARTVFVIAHRFATIRRADRVLVIEQGRIVESGAPDELLARGGRYAALDELQRSGPPIAARRGA